jgi:hypothetical protein
MTNSDMVDDYFNSRSKLNFEYIIKVINSCENQEQLESAQSWANNLIKHSELNLREIAGDLLVAVKIRTAFNTKKYGV